MSSYQDIKATMDWKKNSHTLKVPFDIKHKEVSFFIKSRIVLNVLSSRFTNIYNIDNFNRYRYREIS